MKKRTFICFLLATVILQAENASASDSKLIVGFGGGFEAGNGLRLGIKQDAQTMELGLGLLYSGQDAELKYSTGLRYLRDLYTGRLNDTYAWGGVGVMGHYRSGEEAHLISAGAGLGISLHFGLPFHLNFDSGWRIYYDSQSLYRGLQTGPTINGALIYEW